MNRRDILTAAPAALLVAGTASPASAAPTSDVWARWQAARAAADQAHAVEQAAESEHGHDTPEHRRIYDWASEKWERAFSLARAGFRTPVCNGADAIGKARLLAWDFDCDDWGEPAFGDLIERQLRDLAAAYGVESEVAAILDPVIAGRDARREDHAETGAQWEEERKAKLAAEDEAERIALDWLLAAKAANIGVTVTTHGTKRGVACDLSDMRGDHPGAIDDALAAALVRLADDWRGMLKVETIAGAMPVTFTYLIAARPDA